MPRWTLIHVLLWVVEVIELTGSRQVAQGVLFYEFLLDDHVPQDHVIRPIDRFFDLGGIRQHLTPFYSSTGRLLVNFDVMIRMSRIHHCFGIPIRAKDSRRGPPDPILPLMLPAGPKRCGVGSSHLLQEPA